jgi:ABC-type transporter MlaC component
MRKVLVIVGLVVLVFASTVALLVMTNRDRVVRFASERVLTALEESMARSITDKHHLETVHQKIALVRERFDRGEVSFTQIRSTAGSFLESYRERTLDSLQVDRLERELGKLAGQH